MSAQHTPGIAEATGNGVHIGMRCLAIAHMEPQEQRIEDARRLVACWNACDGLSTEALETEGSAVMGWTRTASKLIRATTQRDELLADLRDAAATLRRYEALHLAKGTADSTEKALVNAALAGQFEVTIAKAEGPFA
jgi:hypothetical protein